MSDLLGRTIGACVGLFFGTICFSFALVALLKFLIYHESPKDSSQIQAIQNLTNDNRHHTQITTLNPNDLVLNLEVSLPKLKRTNTLNPPDSRDASVMDPQAQIGPFIIETYSIL